jgi:hypothetical protein
MIASMFPTTLKAVSTTWAEAPNGWQLVPRQSSAKSSPKPPEVASDSSFSGTPDTDVSGIPSEAAQPSEAGTGKPAKVEGRRKAKSITVRDHLCKLRDGIDSIAAKLRQRQAKASGIMRSLASFKARGHAITTLEPIVKQLAGIVDYLNVPRENNGDNSASIGEIPFSTTIVPRGLGYKHVKRAVEIITAMAKSIEGSAPKVAQELKDVATQLTCMTKLGGL